MKLHTPHILYTLAEQADARFTATIAARTHGQRDRWTMTATDLLIPEIRDAYRAKVTADEAWLTFLRTDSERRTAAKAHSDEQQPANEPASTNAVDPQAQPAGTPPTPRDGNS